MLGSLRLTVVWTERLSSSCWSGKKGPHEHIYICHIQAIMFILFYTHHLLKLVF